MASRFIAPFFDAGSGISPSDGAKLEFFESGTSTQKDTFTDEALTKPNANPVIANGDGVFDETDIFLPDGGRYKVTLKDKNGVQIFEADPVVGGVSASLIARTFDTVAAMVASTELSVGDIVETAGYTTKGDGGQNQYEVVASATGTDDGGSFIDLTGITGQVKGLFPISIVSVKQFGAVGDNIADDTSEIQATIDFVKATNGDVWIPPGDYKVTGMTVTANIRIRGADASTAGTQIFITADAPAFDVTAPCTIADMSIVGEGSGAKTLQAGIKITTINDVYMRNIFFDNCFDNVNIFGEVFFTYIDGCRFQRSVNTMIMAEGNTAPGFAIQILNCQAIPPSGKKGFHFKNYGSVNIDSLIMSPNNLTEEGILFDTPASLAGLQQISNSVIEGSDGVPLRVIGSGGAPADQAKFIFCSNTEFGSGLTQPCVDLTNSRGIYFTSCYFTGGGVGILLNGTCTSTHITDGEFEVLSVPISAGAASVITGLYVTNPDYQSILVFIDLNAAATKTNVSVMGGTIGSNSNPIQPATMSGLLVRLPGVTKYQNGAIATFNGGVSLFAIPHGLVSTPNKFTVLSNSLDAGVAEIREVTVDGSNVNVQCKAAAAGGTNNVKWAWTAEL